MSRSAKSLPRFYKAKRISLLESEAYKAYSMDTVSIWLWSIWDHRHVMRDQKNEFLTFAEAKRGSNLFVPLEQTFTHFVQGGCEDRARRSRGSAASHALEGAHRRILPRQEKRGGTQHQAAAKNFHEVVVDVCLHAGHTTHIRCAGTRERDPIAVQKDQAIHCHQKAFLSNYDLAAIGANQLAAFGDDDMSLIAVVDIGGYAGNYPARKITVHARQKY
jgi:hypothetical protein